MSWALVRRIGGGVITFASIVGLVGLPEDLAKLSSWLAFIGDGRAGWVIPTLVGLALLLLPADTLERARKVITSPNGDGEIHEPSGGLRVAEVHSPEPTSETESESTPKPLSPSEIDREAAARDRGQAPESAERAIADVTPQYLTGLYEQYTSIQADKLAELYIGKWMSVTGPLDNVSSYKHGTSLVSFAYDAFGSISIHMLFRDRELVDRLSVMARGTQITVPGQIEEVRYAAVTLGNCELL